MAVLYGQFAMDGTPLELKLYANPLPGGFHWLVTSSSAQHATKMLSLVPGKWTDHVTAPAVLLQNSYTRLAHVADLRSTLLTSTKLAALSAALLLVRQDPADIAMIGSRIRVVLPGIMLEEFGSPPSIKSPTGGLWI